MTRSEQIANLMRDGLTPAEISKEIGINVCSVRARMRAIKKGVPFKRLYKSAMVKKATRQQIFKEQNGLCLICGCQMIMGGQSDNPYTASIDHIIPVCDGGSNHYANLRMLCRQCNSGRPQS